MKIGVTYKQAVLLGKEPYQRLRELGFEALDYNIENTDTDLYAVPEEEFRARLLKEKALADQAGIEIYQVHGP